MQQKREYLVTESFNRTLWNWNTIKRSRNRCKADPLIEPYGIEIKVSLQKMVLSMSPLIEPYGIEMKERFSA